MAGEQQQPDEPDDLLVVESFPINLCVHQLGHEVVGGTGAAILNVREEVAVHLPHRRSDGVEECF